MTVTTAHDVIAQALETLEEAKSQPTGGKWLERLTAQIAHYIKEWDISHCWTWAEWPDRERLLPETTKQDNGIDAVAIDSSGAHIAIQCKSRQLDENGRGNDIDRPEITSFISESENELYTQRWLVTNGDNRLNDRAERTNSQLSRKIKVFNLHADLTAQAQGSIRDEECPHCQPNPDGEWRRQSKTCMQNDAVSSAVSRLRGQLETDLDGIPIGQARGKIILPCGTGKTRISLRIVDEADIEPADREHFQELADLWENETVLLSNSDLASEHPAHREIVSMGEPAVPLILERMQSQGGHWFHALRELTNANPVKPDDRGNVGAMQAAWLEWGERNGYA